MASKRSSINKSQWVRDQDPSKPAADVVAAAKAKGIAITPAFVYSIRSAAKQAKSGGRAAKAPRIGRAQASGGGGSLDAIIRAIVKEEIKTFFQGR
jgi:hypothetical protein